MQSVQSKRPAASTRSKLRRWSSSRPPHEDHDLSGTLSGSPHPVRVVARDRRRQAQVRAEELQGAGLPVVLGVDAGHGLLLRGEGIEDLGHAAGQLGPTVHVGVELPQAAHLLVLPAGGLQAQPGREFHVGVDREEGLPQGSHVQPDSHHGDQEEGPQPAESRPRDTLDPHRPRREEDRIHPRQIVRLGVAGEEQTQDGQIRHAQRPVRAQPGPDQEQAQPQDPEHRVDGIEHHDLFRQEPADRQRGILATLRVGQELQGGPTMVLLPDEVRRHQPDGQGRGDPGAPPLQHTPSPRGQDAHPQSRHQQGDAPLVEESQTDQGTHPDPSFRGLVVQQPRHQEHHPRPEHQVEGVHGEIAEEGQVDRGQGHRRPRQDLGKATAPQPTHQRGREHHQSARADRRHQADGEDGRTQQVAHEPGHQADEGWMVDVAPGQAFATGEVVELVAEQAVPAREPHVQQGHRGGQDPGKGVATGRHRDSGGRGAGRIPRAPPGVTSPG